VQCASAHFDWAEHHFGWISRPHVLFPSSPESQCRERGNELLPRHRCLLLKVCSALWNWLWRLILTLPGAAAANGNGTVKPLSAIAAARLRSQVPEPAVKTLEIPPSPSAESSDGSAAQPDEELLPVRTSQQLCTWRYNYNNVRSDSDEQLTISLGKSQTVALVGCYDLVVLKGAVNINGANFGAGPGSANSSPRYRVYAPSTHPIPLIRGLDSENEIQFLNCKEPTPFANLSPLFAIIWQARPKEGNAKSFTVVTESDADPSKRPLAPELIPNDWTRQIEDCASSTSTTLITGPSSSGKSTFAKRLVNRYLTGLGKIAQAIPAVYYLELDASAPEYTPHGQISLVLVREVNLGPSFTHSSTVSAVSEGNEVIRSHPLPLRTSELDHDYFLSCVDDLFRTYLHRQQYATPIPLIVNTASWTYTADLDLLRRMLTQIKPRHIIHLTDLQAIDEDNSAKLDTLDILARKAGLTITHVSAQAPSINPSRTTSDLRAMQTLTYFHGISTLCNPTPLSHVTPWEFSYASTPTSTQSLLGFLNYGPHIDPSHLFTALNGALIHIIETHDPAIQIKQPSTTLPRTSRYLIPYFPADADGSVPRLAPQSSRLICTALLRSWIPDQRVAQVLVPSSHEKLLQGLDAEKTVFVFGCAEHPEWAYAEDAYYALAQQSNGQLSQLLQDQAVLDGIDLPPWVATAKSIDGMGYLNVPRRTRKFQK
jgi:polynucleotide 5'-hydroxyl-kinase GRC3/NOL9